MDSIISLFEALVTTPLYFYIAASFCLLFFGEPVIIAVAFIAASYNLFPVWILGVIAFITAVIAEFFWYAIGRFSAVQKFFLHPRAEEVVSLMRRFHIHRPLPLLFVTRLFTGLTIVAIIYLSARGVKFTSFIMYSIMVNAFWTPVVVSVGYLAGKGYVLALTILNNVHVALTLSFVILLCTYIAYRIIVRSIAKRL